MESRSTKLKITGWVLSVLLALFLIVASAIPKFVQWEGKAEMFATLGWTEEAMFTIGIVEAAIAILFLIPRTAFVAAILLTAYLGGATATHVRVDDAFYFPILTGVFAWMAIGLRQPEVFRLTLGNHHKPPFTASTERPCEGEQELSKNPISRHA